MKDGRFVIGDEIITEEGEFYELSTDQKENDGVGSWADGWPFWFDEDGFMKYGEITRIGLDGAILR